MRGAESKDDRLTLMVRIFFFLKIGELDFVNPVKTDATAEMIGEGSRDGKPD